MKKIISLFMVLTMVLSLAACSTNQSPSESTPEESSSQTNESTPTPSNTNGKNLVVYFSMPDNVDDSTVVIDGETLGNTQYMAFFRTTKRAKSSKSTLSYICPMTKVSKYPVFYLMHGGWSNEYTYLGSPDEPHGMKHILDHGIANGKIQPMIVVCPTYNNTELGGQWRLQPCSEI